MSYNIKQIAEELGKSYNTAKQLILEVREYDKLNIVPISTKTNSFVVRNLDKFIETLNQIYEEKECQKKKNNYQSGKTQKQNTGTKTLPLQMEKDIEKALEQRLNLKLWK